MTLRCLTYLSFAFIAFTWLPAAIGGVNETDQKGNTPLIIAAAEGDESNVKALIAAGADVAAENKAGATALIYASMFGHENCVNDLINAHAKVDETGVAGNMTPLVGAVYRDHIDCVNRLIAAGANVNPVLTKSDSGYTCIMEASRDDHVDCVNALIEAGADVNARDNRGVTALIEASLHGNINCIKALLAAHANVNATDNQDSPAINAAAAFGHVDCVKALLDAGANVNVADKDGATPIIFAATLDRLDCVKFLITAGADLNKRDINGDNALGAAKGHPDVIAALKAAGATDVVEPPTPTPFNEQGCAGAIWVLGLLLAWVVKSNGTHFLSTLFRRAFGTIFLLLLACWCYDSFRSDHPVYGIITGGLVIMFLTVYPKRIYGQRPSHFTECKEEDFDVPVPGISQSPEPGRPITPEL